MYIAPEVIEGSYDEKCDIWSCGVLLYLILSGFPPFYGSTRKEVMKKIKKANVSFHGSAWRKISVESKDLITKMLTRNPINRPSCREVLEHPWFDMNDETPIIATKSYLDNMRMFETDSKLMQAVLTFIVTNMTTIEDTNDLAAVFKELDTNKDGKLNEQELVEGKFVFL